tara:strand:- start:4 stop:375 length:372 start_codon:yes stop_codon:yes gene_type:complete
MKKVIDLISNVCSQFGVSLDDVVITLHKKDNRGNYIKDDDDKMIVIGYLIGTRYSWLFDMETLQELTPSSYYWKLEDSIQSEYQLEFQELLKLGKIPKDTPMKGSLSLFKSQFKPSSETMLDF